MTASGARARGGGRSPLPARWRSYSPTGAPMGAWVGCRPPHRLPQFLYPLRRRVAQRTQQPRHGSYTNLPVAHAESLAGIVAGAVSRASCIACMVVAAVMHGVYGPLSATDSAIHFRTSCSAMATVASSVGPTHR